MRIARLGSRSLALTLAGLAIAGCGSSDNTGPSNTPPPAGNYALTSIQNPPNPALAPPVATGVLVLGATTYSVTINITGQAEVQDEGTYTISGTTWTQTSTTNAGVQSSGTYTYSSTTGALSVDVTTAGVRTITSWQRQ